MPLTGWLALIDGVAAAGLLLSIPRQQQNKTSVLLVAAILIGISGWLSVLALDHPRPEQPPARMTPAGSTA